VLCAAFLSFRNWTGRRRLAAQWSKMKEKGNRAKSPFSSFDEWLECLVMAGTTPMSRDRTP
jgi:hypothetical protein